MRKVPQLKKKKHNWSKVDPQSLIVALHRDKIADPGDMDDIINLGFSGVTIYVRKYLGKQQ